MSITFIVPVQKNQLDTIDCNYIASRLGIYREYVSLDINNAQILQILVWGCHSVIFHTNNCILAFSSVTVVAELLSNVEMCQPHDIPFQPLCAPFKCYRNYFSKHYKNYEQPSLRWLCHNMSELQIIKNHKFTSHTSLILIEKFDLVQSLLHTTLLQLGALIVDVSTSGIQQTINFNVYFIRKHKLFVREIYDIEVSKNISLSYFYSKRNI